MSNQGISKLSERSKIVFQHIVDSYLSSGEPVGSKTLSRVMNSTLSAATIRGVMADLEEEGLLFSPHTSAGRLPTDFGLRIFVDGLLELGGDIGLEERASLEGQCCSAGRNFSEVLEDASTALSGLSECAGLVISPKFDAPLRQIEFVPLTDGRALVVMVTNSGIVENYKVSIEEVFTPFPVHGLDHILDLKPSRIAIAAFIYGCIGITFGLLMINYIMIVDWPMNIGGKPNLSLIHI